MEWNLAEAKNRFSELVSLALTQGPQSVRRRRDSVVIISADEYQRLLGNGPSFKEHLLNGESFEGLELTRDASDGRVVEL